MLFRVRVDGNVAGVVTSDVLLGVDMQDEPNTRPANPSPNGGVAAHMRDETERNGTKRDYT